MVFVYIFHSHEFYLIWSHSHKKSYYIIFYFLYHANCMRPISTLIFKMTEILIEINKFSWFCLYNSNIHYCNYWTTSFLSKVLKILVRRILRTAPLFKVDVVLQVNSLSKLTRNFSFSTAAYISFFILKCKHIHIFHFSLIVLLSSRKICMQ